MIPVPVDQVAETVATRFALARLVVADIVKLPLMAPAASCTVPVALVWTPKKANEPFAVIDHVEALE